MKAQFLIPLTIASMLFSSSMVQALPMNTDLDKRADLPPLIPSRIQPASVIPPFDLSLEKSAGSANGAIPSGTEQEGGFAVELPQNISKAIPNLAGVSQASQEQVNSAYFYAELSANAYCKQVTPLGVWLCPHCKTALSDAKIEKTFFSLLADTHGYIVTSASKKTIFLAFRGTNSFRSFFVDLNFILDDYPAVKGTKVHPGFYKSYVEVQKTVIETMGSLIQKYPDYKVSVVGHSLGGAQAELATLDLYQRFQQLTPDNLRLDTVGQPRVGNPNYAAYFLSTKIGKIRTVHKSDLVPHLPPMANSYLHTGTEYWIKDDDSRLTQICQATYESAFCSNTAVPFLTIMDHLSNYNINEGLCL
ncbi:lipase [Cunninghamella echinulata]|nr:lipase [Cunninghamella echinulata]